MRKHLEIERKFLVKSVPHGLDRCRHLNVDQGYFPVSDKRMEIRLRRLGHSHFLTIKLGVGGRRIEEELQLQAGQFDVLWPYTRRARVRKTRYFINSGHQKIEMDVYKGPHKGLVTAEVEFTSKGQSSSFRPLDWFGREVTGKERFANRTLARKPGSVRKLYSRA
jgi:CYTH domain-containing protein